MTDASGGWLFDPSDLTPHGFCLLWQPGLVWTHAAADLAIGAAYFTIPIALILFIRRRRDIVFRPLFALFAAFILLCGLTHWLDILTLWVPAYQTQAFFKVLTATVSVATAITLWLSMPQALALPSPAQLREANEALRKSEVMLNRTGQIAGIGGWEVDTARGEVCWSAETYRIHGMPPDFRPTLAAGLDFYDPKARPIISAAVENALASGEGWDLELPLTQANGRRIMVRTVGSVELGDGKPIRMFGVFQDVTERVAERIALQEAHERNILAAEGSQIGIWDWHVVEDRMVWDHWMCRLYGVEKHSGADNCRAWMRHIHPHDLAGLQQALRDSLSGAKPFNTEFRVVWNDGSVHHIRACGQVRQDEAGEVSRVVGTSWEVTESRELAAALAYQAELRAEAMEREMALFRNSPDLLFIVRVDEAHDAQTFLYETLSPSFERLTGLRVKDAVGCRPAGCLPRAVADDAEEHYRRCVKERVTIGYAGTYTLPVGTRDFEGSITPVQHPTTGRIIRLVGSMRDVTERHQMEEALSHAQKMESIGRLSSGVAHDFNNILQGIISCLELVAREVPAGTGADKFLTAAMNSASRGASLTHHLLSYARKQVLRPQAVRMESLFVEVQALLSRTIGSHISIRIRADHAAVVLADPGQLQTSLLNLAINASHAMPKGGTLSLDARLRRESARRWVVVAVTDTGVGMDEATLAQAMEPFFTTKGLDGTGLGLSMVQGFAEQSGGRLRLSSTLGQGTTVQLLLPLAPVPQDQDLCPTPAIELSGSILLVDDSADILAATGASLEHAGFRVVMADSGGKALALLDEGGRFDAVVSDYAMPGLNGTELIARAQVIQPGLRGVLITGFAAAGYTDALPADTMVLRKPFRTAELTRALRLIVTKCPTTVS